MATATVLPTEVIRFLPNGRTLEHACRACGARGPATVHAHVAATQVVRGWAEWVTCRTCGSASAVDLDPPPYETEQKISKAALKYYVEQNAAIDVMANLIACVRRTGPTRILDVGCGFGFLLDYARGALGWDPQGIDPSTFAWTGRDMLNLPIAFEYLSDENARRFVSDVIVCSEIIEHLSDPDPFLGTLKRTLNPGGSLVMTTPSSRCATAEAGADRNMLAYGGGQHLIVYSAKGLEASLRRAGFVDVQVREAIGGVHLVAACSMTPGSVDLSARMDPAAFRAWLARRAETASDPSLEIGLRGRLLKMAVAAGAWEEAFAAAQGVIASFGRASLDLSRPESLAPPAAKAFEVFAEMAPCNAASVLFNLGRLAEQDNDSSAAESFFRAAIDFGTALNDALRSVLALDLEIADQVIVAAARAAGLRAARDPAGSAAELASIGSSVFTSGACPSLTFLNAVGQAASRGLDVLPLLPACEQAIAHAADYEAGGLWIAFGLSALQKGDAALAIRLLERVGEGAPPDASRDAHRLLDEAHRNLLVRAVAEGRLEQAAEARRRLPKDALTEPGLAQALGILAHNHDRDPVTAAEFFARDPDSADLLQLALRESFMSAVAGGRMKEAAELRLRLAPASLGTPELKTALGILALNHDRDPVAAVEFFAAVPDGADLLQVALRQAFISAVAGGRMDEATRLRSRLAPSSLEAPELQTALGIFALNVADDLPEAVRFFQNSPEPGAVSLLSLARRRAFTRYCLQGELDRAEPFHLSVRSEFPGPVEPPDPDLGRAWAALALYAQAREKDPEKARQYALEANTFELEPVLRSVLSMLLD